MDWFWLIIKVIDLLHPVYTVRSHSLHSAKVIREELKIKRIKSANGLVQNNKVWFSKISTAQKKLEKPTFSSLMHEINYITVSIVYIQYTGF